MFAWHIFQEFRDNVIGGFAFGVGVECSYQPVPQNQGRQGGDIFTSDIESTVASGAGASG